MMFVRKIQLRCAWIMSEPFSSSRLVQSGPFYGGSFGFWLREEHHHMILKSHFSIDYLCDHSNYQNLTLFGYEFESLPNLES